MFPVPAPIENTQETYGAMKVTRFGFARMIYCAMPTRYLTPPATSMAPAAATTERMINMAEIGTAPGFTPKTATKTHSDTAPEADGHAAGAYAERNEYKDQDPLDEHEPQIGIHDFVPRRWTTTLATRSG